MKKIYSILLLLFLLINCTSKDYKADLIGDWYLNESPTNGITFSQDSIYFNEPLKPQFKWIVDKNNINLENPSNLKIDSLTKLGYNFSFYYSLSKNNDTLWLKSKTDTSNYTHKLIRIKNHFKYFQKIINLKIDLKKSENYLKLHQNDYLSLNLYIGFKNDTLAIKTNQSFINLKDNILNEVLLKLENCSKENSTNLKFNLFVDKKVSEFQIDSIKTILRKTPIKRIFRIYKNDTIDYKNNLNWYGKYE